MIGSVRFNEFSPPWVDSFEETQKGQDFFSWFSQIANTPNAFNLRAQVVGCIVNVVRSHCVNLNLIPAFRHVCLCVFFGLHPFVVRGGGGGGGGGGGEREGEPDGDEVVPFIFGNTLNVIC